MVLLRSITNVSRPHFKEIFTRQWHQSLQSSRTRYHPGDVFFTRSIFGFNPTQLMSSRSKEYSENKILGYSMDQLYEVVANVDDYKYFVPWCRESIVTEQSQSHARANLVVGFPPVIEKYTSVITLAKPNLIKSECLDGSLFNHLVCDWRISQGPIDIPRSCTLNFYISFEFKSLLHSQLSSMFFDEVVRQMVNAFEGRCEVLYGCSSLINTKYDPQKRRRRALSTKKDQKVSTIKNRKLIREGS